jgi:hypothetical protein
MALSLKEIQAKLQAQQDKKDRTKNGAFSGESGIYPFWNNPEGSTATMRFLPDGDDTNDFFWVERLIIKLSFPGIKGQNDAKPVEVQVPCMDMWKPNSCPIAAETRPWWKDPQLEDLARKYWRKKSYLFQGFVPQNPNPQDIAPENPIRRFIINPSIFDIIKGILMRPDVENMVTDYDNGRDFYLSKTTKGGYANYSSSSWAMKERPLNDAEREAIDKFKLYNLSQFLPKKPDDAGIKAIIELFHASVNEELYDTERWGQFFRPNGMRYDNDATTNTDATVNATVSPVANTVTAASIMSKVAKSTPHVEETAPWEEPVTKQTDVAPVESKPKMQTPDDILAAIRRRQAK